MWRRDYRSHRESGSEADIVQGRFSVVLNRAERDSAAIICWSHYFTKPRVLSLKTFYDLTEGETEKNKAIKCKEISLQNDISLELKVKKRKRKREPTRFSLKRDDQKSYT